MKRGLFNKGNKGITLLELLGGMAVVAVLAALLFPSLTKAKRAANQAKSVANLRTLGHASLEFAADHDNQLPYYQEEFSSYKPNTIYRLYWFQFLVRDYCDGDYRVLRDPNDNFRTSTGAPRFVTMNTTTGVVDATYSYAMNTFLPKPKSTGMTPAKKNALMCRQAWLERPGQTALYMDACEGGSIGPTATSNFRFSVNGTALNTVFGDGSVRIVSKDVLLFSEATKNAETLRQHQQLWYGDPDTNIQITH